MAANTNNDPGAWRLKSAGLHMRADATEAGKLVRLADVVRWLMQAHELPRTEAVKLVAERLPQCASSDLHVARPGAMPDQFPPRAPEGCVRFLVGRSVSDVAGLIGPRWGTPWPYGQKSDDAILDEPQDECTRLAVSVAKAQELWGWGSAAPATTEVASPFPLADYAALIKYRAAHPGTSWATGLSGDNQIELAKAEFKRQGGETYGQKRKVLTKMAKELGTRAQSLERALFAERKSQTKQAKASPLPSASGKAA